MKYNNLLSSIAVILILSSGAIGLQGFQISTNAELENSAITTSSNQSSQQSIPFVKAPPFTLPSTVGGEVSLSDYTGKKNVLLYFQEGIMCKACWDQLEDIQKVYYKFKPLDIEVVTITVDPINANIKESNKRGITLPVLDDANLSVSKSYDVLDYSMHPL
jgi:cytochrome oxidase Cu insertion factor (SCO1/SenC/PrrC family)